MAENYQTVTIDFSIDGENGDGQGISVVESEYQLEESPYRVSDNIFIDVELKDWDEPYTMVSSSGDVFLHQENILHLVEGTKEVLPGDTNIALDNFPVSELSVNWKGIPNEINMKFDGLNIIVPEDAFGIIEYSYNRREDRWVLNGISMNTLVMGTMQNFPDVRDSCKIEFDDETSEEPDEENTECDLCSAIVIENISQTTISLGGRFYFSVKGAEVAYGGIIGDTSVNTGIKHDLVGWKEMVDVEESITASNGIITTGCPIHDYDVTNIDFPTYTENPVTPNIIIKPNCNKIYVPAFMDVPEYKEMPVDIQYRTKKFIYYHEIPDSWDGTSMTIEMKFSGWYHECEKKQIELTVSDHIGAVTGKNITIYGHDFQNSETPVIGMSVYLGFFGGEFVYQGVLDSEGKLYIEDVPLGNHAIKITSHPLGTYQDTDSDDLDNDFIEVTDA